MKERKILYWLGPILILLGGILMIIGGESKYYYPLAYLVVILAVIAIIFIIKMLIQKRI